MILNTFNLSEKNWAKIFLKRILIIGILLVFLIPPIQAPDENSHFLNAYSLTHGNFYPEYQNNSKLGRYFPENIITYIENWNANDEAVTIESFINNSISSIVNDKIDFLSYWLSDTNLIGYLFPSLGMFLYSSIYLLLGLKVNIYGLLISGRICNLLLYSLSIYYAIKIAPRFKRCLLALALMPMSILQAATLSYDVILISSCFLLFAITVKGLYEEEALSPKIIVILCFISIVLFNIKTVYAPLLGMLAFIPPKRFGGTKKYLITGMLIILCGVFTLGLHQLLLSINTQGFQNPYSALYDLQIHHLLRNPFLLIYYIFNSLKIYFSFYYSGFIGLIGKLFFKFPLWLYLFYGLFLLILFYVDSHEIKILKKQSRICLIAVLGVITYGIFGGIYITWTAIQQRIGVNWVDGVQGRYFIPIAIYLPLALSNSRWLQIDKLMSHMDQIVYYTVSLIPIFTLCFSAVKFWTL